MEIDGEVCDAYHSSRCVQCDNEESDEIKYQRVSVYTIDRYSTPVYYTCAGYYAIRLSPCSVICQTFSFHLQTCL